MLVGTKRRCPGWNRQSKMHLHSGEKWWFWSTLVYAVMQRRLAVYFLVPRRSLKRIRHIGYFVCNCKQLHVEPAPAHYLNTDRQTLTGITGRYGDHRAAGKIENCGVGHVCNYVIERLGIHIEWIKINSVRPTVKTRAEVLKCRGLNSQDTTMHPTPLENSPVKK